VTLPLIRRSFHQEETSNLVAIIISGLVKLTRLLPDGREQIVAILSRGHSVGEVYEEPQP
jgi:CRP-like cAMP-binding protein